MMPKFIASITEFPVISPTGQGTIVENWEKGHRSASLVLLIQPPQRSPSMKSLRMNPSTSNFTEWYIIGNMKIQDILGDCSMRVLVKVYLAEFTVYIPDNDSPVLYFIQHSGFVSWRSVLLSDPGVKIIWANGEREWYIGSELCMSQKSKRLLLS